MEMSGRSSSVKALTGEQLEAVQYPPEGRLKIVAGAGSGKTEVLTRRVLALLERGIPPEALVAITYTNKAAASMKSRLIEKCGLSPRMVRRMQVSTFHAFISKLIREDPFSAGMAPGYTILTENDRSLLLSHYLERFQEMFSHELIAGPDGLGEKMALTVVRAFPGFLSQVRRFLMTPHDFFQTATSFWATAQADVSPFEKRVLHWFFKFYSGYLQELEEKRYLDFDEILVRGKRLLNEGESQGLVQRQQVFLIDEFQDNNQEQLEIINCFLKPERPGSHLTVVGDPKQSIYRFQGADLKTFVGFQNAYEIELNDNFRSYSEILAFADTHLSKDQKHPRFLNAKLGASPRTLPVSCFVAEKKDGKEEAEAIAAMIQTMVSSGLEVKKVGRPLRYGDIAIILSSIKNMPKALEDALAARGIPYVLSGGLGFYDQSEISEIVAILRLLANPNDDWSVAKVLTGPIYGISDSELAKLALSGRQEETPLFRHMLRLPEALLPEKAAAFRTFFLRLQAKVGKVGLIELVYRILEDGGFREYVAVQTNDLRRRRMENNLSKFISIVRQFEKNGIFSSLRDFLAYLDKVLESDIEEDVAGLGLEDTEVVKIMTIHKAKGLEFPVVFMPFLKERKYRRKELIRFSRNQGLLIFRDGEGKARSSALHAQFREEEEAAHEQEERRKYYVALTRAEELLILSGAREQAETEGGLLHELMSVLCDHPEFGKIFDLNEWPAAVAAWQSGGVLPVEPKPPVPVVKRSVEEIQRSLQALEAYFKQSPGIEVVQKKKQAEVYSLGDLALFSQCPKKFLFRKRLLSTFGEQNASPETQLGNLIHRTLRLFHEDNDPKWAIEDRLRRLLSIRETLLPFHATLPGPLLEKATRLLSRYSACELACVRPHLLEAEVNMRLEASSGFFLLRGFTDRVDRDEGGIRVIDYKVRRYSPAIHEEYSFQMALYLAAAQRGIIGELGSLNFAEIQIVYLTEDDVRIVPSEPGLAAFEQWAIGCVEGIRSGDCSRISGSLPCETCEYAVFCGGSRSSEPSIQPEDCL